MNLINDLDNNIRKFSDKYLNHGRNDRYYKNNDKEGLIKVAIKSRVGSAALLYERLKRGGSVINNNFDAIYLKLLNSFKDLIDKGADLKQEDFDNWHNALCHSIDYGMRYGVWQKIINITLKYIECCSDLFTEFRYVLKYAHCPIDKVICKNICNIIDNELDNQQLRNNYYLLAYSISRGLNGKNWNSITEEEYKLLQNAVHEIIIMKDMKKDSEYLSNLEFDIISWN